MSFLHLCIRASFFLSLSANLWATNAPDPASMLPNTLGREFCQEKDISVSFTPRHDDYDFYYSSARVEDNKISSKEPVCSSSIQIELHKNNKLSAKDLRIRSKLGVLIPESACKDPGGAEGNRELCIYNEEGKLVSTARYAFNTRQAAIKDIKDIKAINGQLSFLIDATPGANPISFQVCYGTDRGIKDSPNCGAPYLQHSSNAPQVTIDNIDPDVKYYFKVRIVENNTGKEWSDVKEAESITVSYPIDSYRGTGGAMPYGCQETGKSGWILLFALIVFGFSRFKKAIIGSFLGLSLMIITPKEAHADLGQMNIGLLGAMYRPDLDSEKLSSGQTIFPFYNCHFGKAGSDLGPINPLMGFEVDWHLWDGFGSVQLGLGASYTYVKGHGVKVKNGVPQCGEIFDQVNTALHMFQLRPQLTYIFDPYVDIVPLAPYVRAGLIGHGYVFTQDSKSLTPPAAKPGGFRFGYQVAVGLMLMLDFLEPSSVTNARSGGLFEHVFLKGELSYTKIDSFGSSGFQFSPKDVMGTTLPLMWTFGLVFELPN